MFDVRGVFKVFLGRAPNRSIFYKCMCFRQSKFEANGGKNGSRGHAPPAPPEICLNFLNFFKGGMLPRKFF